MLPLARLLSGSLKNLVLWQSNRFDSRARVHTSIVVLRWSSETSEIWACSSSGPRYSQWASVYSKIEWKLQGRPRMRPPSLFQHKKKKYPVLCPVLEERSGCSPRCTASVLRPRGSLGSRGGGSLSPRRKERMHQAPPSPASPADCSKQFLLLPGSNSSQVFWGFLLSFVWRHTYAFFVSACCAPPFEGTWIFLCIV